MADFTSTRRGLLGAIALAPLVISAPAAAASTEFAAKQAEHQAASLREETFDREVYERAAARFERMAAAIPHTTVRWAPSPHFAGETWSTADKQNVSEARSFLNPRHTAPVQPCQADYHRACLELVAAADARDEQIALARIESGLEAALTESDRLQEVSCAARDAVIYCPISTAAELAAKIAFITEHYQWEFDETREAIAADVARLAA